MTKKKKLTFKRNVTKFNYWEDWSLYDIHTRKEIFRIPIENEEEIEEEIRGQLRELRTTGKIQHAINIARLEFDALNLTKRYLFNKLGDINSEERDYELLLSLTKALKQDKRGSRDLLELKNIIKRDLKEFREMFIKHLSGERYEEFTSAAKGRPDPGLRQIWSKYKKVSDYMMERLGYSDNNPENWVDIYHILLFMSCCIGDKTRIIPLFLIEMLGMPNFVLIKGTGISDEDIEKLFGE